MAKDNVQRPFQGLHKDSAAYDQPKNTYTYALNAVNETELGDTNFVSNEESNEICDSLTPGFIPLGKIYTISNEVVIFSKSETDNISEIGILDNACNYTAIINDEGSSDKDKFNFRVDRQIQGTYRLRLGCERTIYFTDDEEKPRTINLDSLTDYQNEDDTWNANLTSLQKTYSLIPTLQSVEVIDSGGGLLAGSYNIAIQYVDNSLNPTEWITTSRTVNIYNDFSIEEFREIRGSINSDVDYLAFPRTSKAIKVNLGNLDQDFLYYRLAFIEATAGQGEVTAIKYTEVIPTSKDFFIYTGQNVVGEGTLEEIAQFSSIIYRAKNIEQIENRLLLSNTQGRQTNFCRLQRYASRIKADCITRGVNLTLIQDPANPKNPSQSFGGKGYMPGEIYSFGIVYVFEDGSTSPVYHIPGKSSNIDPKTVFSPGEGDEEVYPMSSEDNQGASTYVDNDFCDSGDYWGRDSEGSFLVDTPIRHHRFPLRTDINLPLVTSEVGEQTNTNLYNLKVDISGNLKVPNCPPDEEGCIEEDLPTFGIRFSYTVENQQFFFTQTINPQQFKAANPTTPYNRDTFGQLHSSDQLTDFDVEIEDQNGLFVSRLGNPTEYDAAVALYWEGGVSFVEKVLPFTGTIQGRQFFTEILGIKFSGVDIPTLDDTNGEKIVGYYIMRNERSEFDKTILDSAVLIPSLINSKYISHGLLQPQVEPSKISPSVYGLIHPENKFLGKEYFEYAELIQQGNFNVSKREFSKLAYDDVLDGTSQNSGQKTSDDDGWNLDIISRDNILDFSIKKSFTIDTTEEIKDQFYLDALGSREVDDNVSTVYNIAADNKVGFIELEEGVTLPTGNNLPYVVMRKKNLDAYSNFRVLPYYKESKGVVYFPEDSTEPVETSVFNGDSYVSPMRYVNTMFWDNRIAKRAARTSALKIVLGAVLVAVGAVFAVTGFGAPVGALVIGAGITIIGGGALLFSSGIKQANFEKAYLEEYEKGLRETALDDWVDSFYNYRDNNFTNPQPPNGTFGFTGNGGSGKSGPSDDSIQWIGDCLTDLWFETSINTSLRHGMTGNAPTFLNSPGLIESGQNRVLDTWEYFDVFYITQQPRASVSSLDRHLTSKLLAFDPEREDNKLYIGLALGEYYALNLDYQRENKEKIYFHLPLEYDCCSECTEDFPHRVAYSQQSFQEELSDNYRVFLPNNYRDIEAETGEVVNMFRIGGNLFIHTYEGLWQLPRNYQERVTDQIISFVGTGSYFEIPPQKIMDDDTGSTAGLQHKWSAIKTPSGYFFVCENQRKIYEFNGRQLKPISSFGLENWFKENLPLENDRVYYDSKQEKYIYRDNPSNPFGTGFISTYDTKKERLLFTKKDFLFNAKGVENGDFEICTQGSDLVLFPNISETIAAEAQDGWVYLGIENCRLKFDKITDVIIQEEREVTTTIPSDTIVIPFFDTTSMGPTIINNISATLDAWFPGFKNSVEGGDNNITYLNPGQGSLPANWNLPGNWNYWGTERWAKDPAQITLDNLGPGQDILLLVFVDETNSVYHGGTLTNPMSTPTQTYAADAQDFVDSIFPSFASFRAVNYPIVRQEPVCKEYLQHAIAAIKGQNFTVAETGGLNQNPNFTDVEWGILTNNLLNNPYQGQPILQDYGWFYKENRVTGIDENISPQCPETGFVISPCQFTIDIEELLQSTVTTETIIVDVLTEVREIKYLDGEIVQDPLQFNNSWTMSYALQTNDRKPGWVSWHSYLPSFYINVPEKFYSWIYGDDNIWKHNKKYEYQTFYGEFHPHVLEYISLSNAIVTRLWNHVKLLTEAKEFDEATKQYVDARFKTFSKAIMYNTRQCTGLMDLVVKDTQADQQNYLSNQIVNTNNNSILIDRNERDWTLNDLRDIRTDYNSPIWDANINSVQAEYYVDKILNTVTMDVNKDWTQLESFRDKYLAIRLIFDIFANTKLITNYSAENEQQSFR
jgi:hypothetical protein